ncbi:MAG TPA: lytic transglycosylase domain-containing protein, partial [Candidatus Ozemobacteraceae bacterium]
ATPYQRGRALEALIDLHPPASRERSLAALEALRAYRAETAFYQNMAESVKLLDAIVGSPAGWAFTPDEWVEIVRAASREKLGAKVDRLIPAIRPALGAHGGVIGVILQAEAAALAGGRDRALALLDGVLATPGLDPASLAFAHQIRGDILSAASRHAEAVTEFQNALAWEKPPVDPLAARYRLMRSAFTAGRDQEALAEAETLCADETAKKLSLLPVHLYEMGLERFDRGIQRQALAWFQLMARAFPGHHRADDALGYAAICAGTNTPEGKQLLAQLEKKYPHSFYLYWLAPDRRATPLPHDGTTPAAQKLWKGRAAAWTALLRSPFEGIAREEIRSLLAAHPEDLGLFKLAVDTAEAAGQHNLTVAVGEILMRTTLEQGRSAATLPAWAWRAHYPRPWWSLIQREAKRYGIDPYWALSIMREESHFNPTILSRSNAHGLMQILPSTGKWIAGKLGIKGKFQADSLWNVDRNIAFGIWYLGYLRDLFNGDLFLAAAAYNGGQGNITRKVEQGPYAHLPVLTRLDRVPLPETRDYYKKVMGSWWNYTRLYK